MATDRTGFLIDEHGNYAVEGGTFVIGDSRHQEAMLIVAAHQGEYKRSPLTGCNPSTWQDYIGGRQGVLRTIKQQIENDGLRYEDYQTEIESNL